MSYHVEEYVPEARVQRTVPRVAAVFLLIIILGWSYDVLLVVDEEREHLALDIFGAPPAGTASSSGRPAAVDAGMFQSGDALRSRPEGMSRQCNEAPLPDCGPVNHSLLCALLLSGLVFLATDFSRWRAGVRLQSLGLQSCARSALKLLATAVLAVLVLRAVMGVEQNGFASRAGGGDVVAGAFVLSMPSATAKWAAMERLLQSFPWVQRVPGTTATNSSDLMGDLFHMPVSGSVRRPFSLTCFLLATPSVLALRLVGSPACLQNPPHGLSIAI